MNIDKELYSMIFKRKSFHLFRNIGDGRISANDIEKIGALWFGIGRPEVSSFGGIDFERKQFVDAGTDEWKRLL